MPVAANLRIAGSIGEAAPATHDPAAGDIFNLALAGLAASSGEGQPAGEAAQAPAAAAEEQGPDGLREESDPVLVTGELLRLSQVELVATPVPAAPDKAAAGQTHPEQPLVETIPSAPPPGPGLAAAEPPAAPAPGGKLPTVTGAVAATIVPQPHTLEQGGAREGAKAHPIAAPAQEASAPAAIQPDDRPPLPPAAAATATAAAATGARGAPKQLSHPQTPVQPAAAGHEQELSEQSGKAQPRAWAAPSQAAPEKSVPDPRAARLVSGEAPPPASQQAPLDGPLQRMEKRAPIQGVHLLQPELAQAGRIPAHPRGAAPAMRGAAPAMAVPEAAAVAVPEASATGPIATLLSRQEPALAPAPVAAPAEAAAEASAPAAQAQPAERVVEAALDLAVEAEWLDHLARDIASASSGDGAPLRFRLNPEHLGTLRVEISTDRSGSAVRITADTEAARSIIADAQPRLVAEARAQGVRISETHVELASQHGSGDPRRQPEPFREAPLRTARLLHEADPSDGNPTRTKTDRYA